MKMYQYPPRRGNGSYWTLLSDGEDELKRAIPLFSTFQPPVIDPESVYNRTPATHTVKSRGQFVPVLPRADGSAGSQPYFSVNNSTSFGDAQREIVILQSSEDDGPEVDPEQRCSHLAKNVPVHLLDHSYAKQLPQLSVHSSQTVDFESSLEAPMTPKRKKLTGTPPKKHNRLLRPHRTLSTNVNSKHPTSNSNSAFSTVTTPSSDHDLSLSFLDSSLLTPLKEIVNDIDIGGPQGISLSPLYANFVSPRFETPSRPPPANIPSPLTPFRGTSMDSGIFTPFRPADTLDSLDSLGMKCSTPLKLLSPISNILPSHAFSTPHQDLFPSVKILDNSTDCHDSSIRLGSLQALGLPGLTPPSNVQSR